VQRREVHCALDLDGQNTATDFGGKTTDAHARRVRLNSAGLLRSVPTVQGGFALALGFSSPWLLDDLNNFSGADVYRGERPDTGYADVLTGGDTLLRDRSDHASRGQCNLWGAGIGWQIAPSLGFGFSLGLLSGSESRSIEERSHTAAGSFDNTSIIMDREYLGWDARLGLLYKSTRKFSLGCRLELPRYAKTAENYEERDSLYGTRYDTTCYGALRSSFAGAVGAALELPFVIISADVSFRSPLPGARPGSASSWKGTVGMGVEVPLRALASVVRGGCAYGALDLSSMHIAWDGSGAEAAEPLTVVHNSRLFTAGYSLYIGTALSLDLAWEGRFWAFSTGDPLWQGDIVERHSLQRGVASISIRY
jgi:hypothetical protein